MQKLELEWGKLAYDIKGEGDPLFVIAHNAGGNHEMVTPFIDHFSQLGRVLYFDMRGHGKSDHPNFSYTVESLAEDLERLTKPFDKAIFVGLNYGALLGIAKADLFSHLILIEPPICLTPAVIKILEEHIEELKTLPQDIYAQKLVDAVLHHAPKETAYAAFREASTFAQISIYEHLIHWKIPKRIKTPTLVVQTKEPFAKSQDLKSHFAALEIRVIPGTGPWITLEAPETLHQIISEYIDSL